MKRAYVADTLVDAHLIYELLDGHGIGCEVFHQNSVGAIGDLPVTPPEVWVRRDADLDLARSLIFKLENERKVGDVYCPRCGEINPAEFDICWQCQTQLVD